MNTSQPSTRRRQRGLSLIEALVAMTVMAIGMLGVVGVQSTLRTNSDLSKQRAEAVRLAQETVEQWRAYVAVNATAGQTAYNDLISQAPVALTRYTGGNTVYTRVVTVNDLAALGGSVAAKELTVTVSWADRTATFDTSASAPAQNQSVQLSTVIAGVDPVLSATLGLQPASSNYQTPQGRSRSIPLGAKSFPQRGVSVFLPPGTTGVAWRFDNSTAIITVCTTPATSYAQINASTLDTDITCNESLKAVLIAGFVRFLNTASQPTAAEVFAANATTNPNVAVTFMQTGPNSTPASRACISSTVFGPPDNFIEYYCAVPTTQATASPPTPISGSVEIVMPDPTTVLPSLIATSQTEDTFTLSKVCRLQQPGSYTTIIDARVNQNFVIMPAGDRTSAAQPTATAFDCLLPSSTNPVIWRHQPAA